MSALTLLAPAGVLAYTLNLLLHLTVICLAVLAASRLLFRRDPAARHTLCLTGLICLLLAPIVVGIEAKAGHGLITLSLPTPASATPIPSGKELALSASDKTYRVAISAALPTQPTIAWSGWGILVVYLLGSGWGALRFAHGCRNASRLKQDVAPWTECSDSATLRLVERVLHAPAPPVFTSPHVASPIAIGILRPAVILPEGLSETLTPRQLRHVLLHECAHVTFRHGFGGLLERIAGVLFWPHPLVRALCRELARAREEVCDNFASQEDGATCYARTLLAIAQGIDIAPNFASTLALLSTGTSLEARIAGLLDPRRNRMVSLKRWKLWAVTGTAVFAMASTAAIRVVAAQEKAAQTPGGVLPGENAVTQVFAFQFMDANDAAEILYSSLPAPLLQQIDVAVDNRTNSMIVQSSGKQMAAIAALFGRLEAQAALDRAKQEQDSAPVDAAKIAKRQAEAVARLAPVLAADATQIAKRQAEAEAQMAQAERAAAQARSAQSTQNRVQTGSVPAPHTSAHTRSAASALSAQASTGRSQAAALKLAAERRQLEMKVQIVAKKAALAAVPGTKITTSNYWKASPVQTIHLKALNATASDPKSVTTWIILDAKSVGAAYKSADEASPHKTGVRSEKSVSFVKPKVDKVALDVRSRDLIATYRVQLDAANEQLDKITAEKLLQDIVTVKRDRVPDWQRQVSKAADRDITIQYEKQRATAEEAEAVARLEEMIRARAALDAANSRAQKNPK
jgi:beta-lactamase regulating signal transducer with metallopeptidase domain